MSDNINRFTFTWKIENFSMLPHQKGEVLSSSTFLVDMWKETEWYLSLYPRGDEMLESGGHVSLYFSKTLKDTVLKVNYTLALESTDSSSEIIRANANCPTKNGKGFSKFISLIDLYEKKNLWLPNDTLTLRFELSPADESSADEKVINESASPQYFMTKRCVSRTSILVHRRSMIWQIENINDLRELQENSIQLSSALKGLPSLKIAVNFSEMDNKDYVPIEISQTSLPLNKEQLFVKCNISVIGADKESQDSEESTHLFNLEHNDVFYFPSLIKTSKLTADKYLYLDDTLLLHCNFAFSFKSDIYHSEFNHMPLAFKIKKIRRKTELIKSIEALYMHGKFCDVQLEAGDEVFPAFKTLLCARSSVFTAMFEHDMKEKNSNVVKITDVEPTTLKRMLEFIHVTSVKEELSPEDARKLYKAANKYNIVYLKRICSILLTSSLSVENVCNVLSFADTYEDNFLMNAANSFVSTHSSETFHSTNWEKFMNNNPKLSMKIMHQFIKEK